MIRFLVLSTALVLSIAPVKAGSIEPPAGALKVAFQTSDHTPKSGPMAVDVIVTEATGPVDIVPTSTPTWMTYNPKTHQFSGMPVDGQHELAVSVTDTGTGQQANGILTLNIEPRRH